jgi:hypothetical protein
MEEKLLDEVQNLTIVVHKEDVAILQVGMGLCHVSFRRVLR